MQNVAHLHVEACHICGQVQLRHRDQKVPCEFLAVYMYTQLTQPYNVAKLQGESRQDWCMQCDELEMECIVDLR